MNNNNFQDAVNSVCNFLENATLGGDRFFYPMIYREAWAGILNYILDNGIAEFRDKFDESTDYYNIKNCLSDLDFLYAFFEELDGINLFNIIDEKHLETRSFHSNSGDSYSKHIVIPGSVKNLNSSFFQNCSGIESIVFETPSSMETLPRGFLLGCKNLKELTISNRIKKIGILAIDTEELPDLKIHVKKEIPESLWNVSIAAANDDTVDYWKSHIVRDQ